MDVFFYFDSVCHSVDLQATNDIGLINMDVILAQSKILKKFPNKAPTMVKIKYSNTIEEAIEDIRQGKIIIVVDDEDRENEVISWLQRRK
jgi:hypothetical protein